VVALLAFSALGVVTVATARPALAALGDMPIAQWNIRGAMTDGNDNNRWQSEIPPVLNGVGTGRRNDLLAVQESGPAQATWGAVTDVFHFPGCPDVSEYWWNRGSGSRTELYFVYWAQTDPGGNRNNLAIVSRNQAAAVLCIPNAIGTRPTIGIRVGDTWYFNIHAAAGGGNDAANLLAAIDAEVADLNNQNNTNYHWAALGDFNRSPQDLDAAIQGIGAGFRDELHIYDSDAATWLGSQQFPPSELDYMVANVEVDGLVGRRTRGATSDHALVEYMPFQLAAAAGNITLSDSVPGTNRTLDISGRSTADGTPVIDYHYHADDAWGANQQFSVVPVAGGALVVNVNSGKCIDVSSGRYSAPDPDTLDQWTCDGNPQAGAPEQLWSVNFTDHHWPGNLTIENNFYKTRLVTVLNSSLTDGARVGLQSPQTGNASLSQEWRPAVTIRALATDTPQPALPAMLSDPDPGPPPVDPSTASNPACRPDGMIPTPGVNTPYCLEYDQNGQERMGATHPRRVIGYFTGWRTGQNGQPAYLVGNIPWNDVTHINYAFAYVDASNQISVGPDGPDNPATGMQWPLTPGEGMDASLPYMGHFNLLTQYKQRHPRVKTLISVGGWAETGGYLDPTGSRVDAGGFYRMTNNADGSINQPAIDAFAASVVAFLRKYSFDGVDIDYEYPTALPDTGNPADRATANARRSGLTQGYAAVVKTLRENLDRAAAADEHYYLLSSAVSASGYLLRGMENFPGLPYLDYANLMSYDMHGSWNQYVGPNSPLYDDGNDAELAAAGIYSTPEYGQIGYFNDDWAYHYFRGALQAGRINLGIPYYTRGWQNVSGGTNGLWGTAPAIDQSQCPAGTGLTTPCGAGATGIDNVWHDSTSTGAEIPSGSNPLWHAKNLQNGVTGDYLASYGVNDTLYGSYTRSYDTTSQSAWLWNDSKHVFLSIEDEQSVDAKIAYVTSKGLGGVMLWELAGDYDYYQGSSEYFMGSSLTRRISAALASAGPYTGTRSGRSLPGQTIDVHLDPVNFPTDVADMYPMQPTLRVANDSGVALPQGTQLTFDMPTSTPSLFKDGAWQVMPGVVPGQTGGNVGGLQGDFHHLTITLGYCEDIPAGATRDIPIKYYLPATGPIDTLITIGGTAYGVTEENRQGTQQVTPTSAAGESCTAPAWDPNAIYNPSAQTTEQVTVSYGGHYWRALWWTQGDVPGSSSAWKDLNP
jgi:GH18 family chitinase